MNWSKAMIEKIIAILVLTAFAFFILPIIFMGNGVKYRDAVKNTIFSAVWLAIIFSILFIVVWAVEILLF